MSFNAGDKFELVQRTDSTEDWWTGKLDGIQGVFPGQSSVAFLTEQIDLRVISGNYVQET